MLGIETGEALDIAAARAASRAAAALPAEP
jgi:hypothetical protein